MYETVVTWVNVHQGVCVCVNVRLFVFCFVIIACDFVNNQKLDRESKVHLVESLCSWPFGLHLDPDIQMAKFIFGLRFGGEKKKKTPSKIKERIGVTISNTIATKQGL